MRLGQVINGHPPHALAMARRMRQVTQQELADMTGLSKVAVAHIEARRVKSPHVLTKRALADALKYEVHDIWPPPGKRPKKELRP
jgi:DNA-binding XRE family transcriptional regulator